jgi:hypothetical protein
MFRKGVATRDKTFRAENFSHLNRTKEFGTVYSPWPTQVQESRGSTRDFDQMYRPKLCIGD